MTTSAPRSNPEFKPGFRFSGFDALILAVGGFGAWQAGARHGSAGFVIAFAVGHFFLFCNVFRISRRLELLWAGFFLILARSTIVSGHPTWTTTALVLLAATGVVITIELRKPSYHGIAWNRFNPNLRQWWEANVASKNEAAP
jgi:hypothetical protein